MNISETNVNNMLDPHKLLVYECKRWKDTYERGGDNRGQVVEMFQKTIGEAVGEPWCMSFVQFCLKMVQEFMKEFFLDHYQDHNVYASEHCWSVWKNTHSSFKTQTPKVGSIAIWKSKYSTNGHTGIVVAIEGDEIWTIEGNTSPTASGNQREGDAVALKKRNLKGMGSLELVGFIDPWPEAA